LKNFQNNSIRVEGGEISLYKGILTVQNIVQCSVKIKKAFPDLPSEFFEVFQDMIKSEGFTDERLIDAVDNVIKTCIYPKPTIAQFISWDKRVKIFKYPDIIKMVEEGDPNAFDRYKRIELDGLPEAVWIHINDVAKYKIKSKT
jgi:hypothetical protein